MAVAACAVLLAVPGAAMALPARAQIDGGGFADAAGAAVQSAAEAMDAIALDAGAAGRPFQLSDDYVVKLNRRVSGVAELPGRGSATLLEVVFADDAGAVPTVSSEAQALAILGELERAEMLVEDSTKEAIVTGLLHMTGAQAQADYALVNLRDGSGRFGTVGGRRDGSRVDPSVRGHALMLMALSRLTGFVSGTDAGGAYRDPGFATWFAAGADDAAALLVEWDVTEADEWSMASVALGDYLSRFPASPHRVSVLAELDELAGLLAEEPVTTAIAHARAVAGLLARRALTGDDTFDDAARAHMTGLLAAAGPGEGVAPADGAGLIEALSAYRRVFPDDPAAAEAGDLLSAVLGDLVEDGLSESVDVTSRLSVVWSVLGLRDDPAFSGPRSEPRPQALVDVVSTDTGVTPREILVPAGAAVSLRLANRGTGAHVFAIGALGLEVDVRSGDSAELSWSTPATATAYQLDRTSAVSTTTVTIRVVVVPPAADAEEPTVPAVTEDPTPATDDSPAEPTTGPSAPPIPAAPPVAEGGLTTTVPPPTTTQAPVGSAAVYASSWVDAVGPAAVVLFGIALALAVLILLIAAARVMRSSPS